ncbi:MAG: hypothetical protein SVY53_12740 [Chloroflexota bacterium]|nr:hypothetical protein [Chloroflexota bacterium]
MAYGLRGRNRGGFGRGLGYRFRGSSPPWPYIGRGRGGLPRCAKYWDIPSLHYQRIPYPDYAEPSFTPSYLRPREAPYSQPQTTREEGLDSLRDHAEMLKQQLEEIEARTRDLETGREQEP